MPKKHDFVINRERLRDAIKKSNFNQSQVALYTSVDKSVISQLLSGKQTGVTMRTLMRLSNVLKVKPTELVMSTDVETMSELNEETAQSREERLGREIVEMLEANPDLVYGLEVIPENIRTEELATLMRTYLKIKGVSQQAPPEEADNPGNRPQRRVAEEKREYGS